MKPITEKVLRSGLVDRHMAEMLEKWGGLPAGAAELVQEDALKDATREQLLKLAEEIGDEVDKERTLRETSLDLDRIRWPVTVTIAAPSGDEKPPSQVAFNVQGVIDRMGRFYFRVQDVNEEWFVPGYVLIRNVLDRGNGIRLDVARERILEKSVLYIDEQPVCVQVSTVRVA